MGFGTQINTVLLVIPALFFKDFKGVKMDLKNFPETFF